MPVSFFNLITHMLGCREQLELDSYLNIAHRGNETPEMALIWKAKFAFRMFENFSSVPDHVPSAMSF